MGWDFIRGIKKDDLVKRLLESKNFVSTDGLMVTRSVIASRLVGNTLWTVVCDIIAEKDGPKVEKYIVCNLLDPHMGSCGYKSIDEACHPYYYDCPVEFLELAPVANQEWRDGVLECHEARTRALAPA